MVLCKEFIGIIVINDVYGFRKCANDEVMKIVKK